MDTEDRDHFKTIASQSAAPQVGLPRPQSAGTSHSDQYPAYCLKRTQILFSCYRKDEAHDAELYCAAVASTLACYDRAVVDHVTDPRSGIASEVKFLPAVAEIRSFCNTAAARMKLHERPERRIAVPYVPPPVLPGQITYGEFLKRVATGELKPRPIGRFELEL
jgi:hypothetical protein